MLGRSSRAKCGGSMSVPVIRPWLGVLHCETTGQPWPYCCTKRGIGRYSASLDVELQMTDETANNLDVVPLPEHLAIPTCDG